MAFVDPTSPIEAQLTDQGRNELGRLLLGEVSLQLTSFQVGRGGYDVANPVRTVPIMGSDTALTDPVPGGTDRRAFVTIENPIGPNVVAPICRLNPSTPDVEFGLGELGIFCTYLRDDVTPGNVGSDFLFALSHFPLLSKTPTHTLVWRVMIAL